MRFASRWPAVAVLLVVATAAAAQTDDPYLAEEAPDVVFDQPIVSKVYDLDLDPVAIFEFVLNEIEFENYYGLLKGPVATLRSGGGNDYDQAALLVSMLRRAGYRARFVRGRISIASDRAAAWTGIDETPRPDLGQPDGWAIAEHLFRAQPSNWEGDVELEPIVVLDSPNRVETLHVWVEAEVPLADYRGSNPIVPAVGDPPPPSSPRAWVPLDPSFFLQDWSPAPTDVPIGEIPALTFDYADLYREVTSELPHEIFESQVRTYLADQYQSGMSEELRTVEDVGLHGTPRLQRPRLLPTALPYELSIALDPRRDASLVELHKIDLGSGWPFSSGIQGADSYRHRRTVHVCIADGEDCDLTGYGELIEASAYSAEWIGRRVVVHFPPTSGSASRLLDDGYAQCEDSWGLPIIAEVEVAVDGVPEPVFITPNATVCDAVWVVFVHEPPSSVEGGSRQSNREVVGGIYLASHDSGVADEASVGRAAAAVLEAQDTWKVTEAPGGELFVDRDDDGVQDGDELLFAKDFEAQEALTGSLLRLASEWMWSRTGAAARRINALHQLRPRPEVSSANAIAALEVDYLFDVPFGSHPARLTIDIGGAAWSADQRDTGSPPEGRHSDHLRGHTGSALEHAVWEAIAGTESISTVRGLQLASEVVGTSIVSLASRAEAESYISSLLCNEFDCVGLDLTGYCLIKNAFVDLEEPWLIPVWDAACPYLPDLSPDGLTLTELRVASESFLEYGGWQGYAVWAEWLNTDGEAGAGYLISGGANGGATVEGEPLDPFAGTGNDIGEVEAFEYDPEAVTYELPGFRENYAGDPVSIFNGNYYRTDTDIDLPGPGGTNLRMVRSYNSRSAEDYVGPLGHGWVHTFDQHLRIEPDPDDPRVVWVDENGSETPWDDDGSAGALDKSGWNRSELVRNADGSFTLTTRDGTVYRFHPPAGDRADLDTIQDRNGNTITCHYDASGRLERVEHTNGKELTFEYAAGTDFLAEIRAWPDADGDVPTWEYEVDGNGDLVEYVDAVQSATGASGAPWRFKYYADHKLRCWIAPEQRTEGTGEPLCADSEEEDQVATQNWLHFEYYDNGSVYRHVDGDGNETRFSYDYFRRRTDVTLPDGSVETHHFDGAGNVTKFVSAAGTVREFEYDPDTRARVVERDAFGLETRARYDVLGNRVYREDRLGHVERWRYNGFSQPTYWRDKRGHERHWEYDANGNLLRERIEVDGESTVAREYAYDGFGNRVEETEHRDPDDDLPPAVSTFTYAAGGVGRVRETDPLGNVTRYTLDAYGRPVRAEVQRTVRRDAETLTRPVVREFEYDKLGRVVAATGPTGTRVETSYDANGKVTLQRTVVPDPDPAISTPAEERTDVVNRYDALGRLIERTDAEGNDTRFAYDARGRRTRIETALGHVTTREYDADGRLVREVDPTGAVWRWRYDAAGRRTRAIDPLGQTRTFAYDAEGRLVEETGPGGRVVRRIQYDPNGNPEHVFDGEDRHYVAVFDALNRRTELRGPVGTPEEATTTFEYDLGGRLLSKEDPEGRVERVRYDAKGRAVERSDGLGRKTLLTYDELGNRVESLDPAGRRMRYRYDDRGLLLERRSLDDASVHDRYAYDGYGRRVWASNAVATITTAYDDLDRPVEVRDSDSGVSRFVYDDDGRLQQFVYASDPTHGLPEGRLVHYQYDGTGRVVAISDTAHDWLFEHDALGRPVRRRDPGGVERRVRYDDRAFVDTVEVRRPAGQSEVFRYLDYDDVGRPGRIERVVDGSVEETSLEYDAAGRLEAATYADLTFEEFDYDGAGNRTSHLTRAGQLRTIAHDGASQITQITDASTATAIETYEHDAAGRVTARRDAATSALVEGFAYDSLGRLTSATAPGGWAISLGYGPEGARRTREETAPTAASFIYPRGGVETRAGVRTQVIGAQGLDAVVGEIREGEGGGLPYGLHRDARTNVAVVGLGGGFHARARYEAFGAPLGAPPAGTGPATAPVERAFAGRPVEGVSGLVNMRARHYHPALGRFLQPDPLGILADHPYAYAANNPYAFIDPLGLAPVSITKAFLELGMQLGHAGGDALRWLGVANDIYDAINPIRGPFELTVSAKYGAAIVVGVDVVARFGADGLTIDTANSSVVVGFGAAVSAKGRLDTAGLAINPFAPLVEVGDSPGEVSFGAEVAFARVFGLEATTAVGADGGNVVVKPVVGIGVEAVAPAVRFSFDSIKAALQPGATAAVQCGALCFVP